MFDPDCQRKYEETGQDWVYWGNSVSKEISSATETAEEWQQGHLIIMPPERHPCGILSPGTKKIVGAFTSGSEYFKIWDKQYALVVFTGKKNKSDTMNWEDFPLRNLKIEIPGNSKNPWNSCFRKHSLQ